VRTRARQKGGPQTGPGLRSGFNWETRHRGERSRGVVGHGRFHEQLCKRPTRLPYYLVQNRSLGKFHLLLGFGLIKTTRSAMAANCMPLTYSTRWCSQPEANESGNALLGGAAMPLSGVEEACINSRIACYGQQIRPISTFLFLFRNQNREGAGVGLAASPYKVVGFVER
jgi:hypothetical protein